MFVRMTGCFSLVVACASGVTGTSLAAAGEEGLRFSGSLSLIEALQYQEPVESSLNFQKKVLDIPLEGAISEVRPSLKLKDDQVQMVFRPRIRSSYNAGYKSPSHNDHEVEVKEWVTDAFLQWTASPQLIFAYGRQNYQWGPAEMASPSNRIFHETAADHNILYLPDGKNLARINLSMGQNFSAVAMVEYEENRDETPFMADAPFAASGLVKPELNWNGGVDYLGLVLGGRADWHPWVGEYFSIRAPFLEGLSIYGDAAQEHGSAAWYPRETTLSKGALSAPPTVSMEHTQLDDSSVYNFSVAGARYDFIGGSILRVEYVRQDAGYASDELHLIQRSFLSQDPGQRQLYPSNVSRFVHPGLELPGTEYWFSSLYSPDFLKVIDLNFYVRILYSVTDSSSGAYSSLDYKIGNSGTLSGSVLSSSGARDSELRGTVSPAYMLAYKMDW